MNIPEGFLHLSGVFYQLSRSEYDSERAWIAGSIAHMPDAKKREAKRFIAEIVRQGVDDDALLRIWRSTGPSYDFFEADRLRNFLEAVHDAL